MYLKDVKIIKSPWLEKDVIIYGAGNWGRKAYAELKGKANVLCYAVTKKTAEQEDQEIDIVEIQDLAGYKDQAMVLVAVADKESQQSILSILKKYGFEDVKLLDGYFYLLKTEKWLMLENKEFCCPICGSRVPAYAVIGEPDSESYDCLMCPECYTVERHRGLWQYFKDFHVLEGKKRVLHFAPESGIYNHIRCMDHIDYYPVDIDRNRKNIRAQVDITSIPYEDNYFDVIICSHVLEHIKDEKQAMQELYRVLKPGGEAYIITPFEPELLETLECEEYNTPELRKKYYGLEDHVRLNGTDYFLRLSNVGFEVKRKMPFRSYNKEFLRENAINQEEEIDICIKHPVKKNVKILIWGTGMIAEQVIRNGIQAEVIGFIETVKSRESFLGRPVYEADKLPDYYDYIVVANTYVNEIYQTALKLQIDMEHMIFLREVQLETGCKEPEILQEILGEKNYTNYCSVFSKWQGTFFETDLEEYRLLNSREHFAIDEKYLWPVIGDRYAMAGRINNYFWQDLWASRLVVQSGTREHFDIGSRIDGFIAQVLASGIEVSVIDIREFPGEVEQLHTIVDDATSLKQIADESINSMSALCSLEHFGLGRYGDPIDPEACFKCFAQIQKKMKRGGDLYVSLPIGKERVEFNAHRVFYPSTIAEAFSEMVLKEFSCTAAGKIEYQVDLHKYDDDRHHGNYRYGLFHFEKI